MSTDDRARVWLRRQGAEQIAHLGGNLYAHLCRVSERVAVLGCASDVQAAGLTHAVYGTDGFDLTLLDRADRAVLRDLVGADAEKLVYLYGACDRGRSWRELARTGEVFDRFARQVRTPDETQLRWLVDLSIVNELDSARCSPPPAATGAWAPRRYVWSSATVREARPASHLAGGVRLQPPGPPRVREGWLRCRGCAAAGPARRRRLG
ncbi:DUF6817 domain-containing protein [Micromonospora ureilytica]|uniref:DUF6817 domain-containing protein n=1 Tax=Micromonospora ureilytica TaxID=709868 RepID=UPI00197C54D7|nr:hypothetical protein [Micromonospora ureilytica]